MPELPEVETVCRSLNQQLQGKTLIDAQVRCKKLRIGSNVPLNLGEKIKGLNVLSVRRKGKYILINLTGELTLLCHLGMTGKLLVSLAEEENNTHNHIVITLSSKELLIYNDVRRFGLMELYKTKDIPSLKYFKKMGLEPLENSFTGTKLLEAFSKRKGAIKPILLNQEVIAGLGNIYACEVLYRTGISPLHEVKDITIDEADELAIEIKRILQQAIKAGGTTFRDYRHTDGSKGEFANELSVYGVKGKQGKTCQSCSLKAKCAGVAKIVQAGRTTFFCPLKQN